MLGLVTLFAIATALAAAIYVIGIAIEALRPPRATAAWAMARGRPSCPADLGLESTEWILEPSRRRGLRLPVWEIELSKPTSPDDARTVIFIHGWGRSRIDSLGRIGPFLDTASRMLFVDLAGHGDANGQTSLGDGDERDLAELVAKVPDGRVVLVGHSLGATVAIRAAAMPEVAPRIERIIAIAPYDTVRSPIRGRLVARELPVRGVIPCVVAALRVAGIRPVSTLAAARELRVPLTVLHGDKDRVSPLSEGEAIAAAAKGEWVIFDDVEHAEHETRRPELFVAAVRGKPRIEDQG
ncbi:MAG: alpha/beta hydrolase [Phycisphaerae bacterium]|nr:alpha/beta hydrolase [Phycisphaerae bacterium]